MSDAKVENNKRADRAATHTIFSKRNGKGFFSKILSSFDDSKNSKVKANLRFELQNITAPDLGSYDMKKSYAIGPCSVNIASNSSGKLFYLISEPPMTSGGKKLYARIMNYLFVSLSEDLPAYEKSADGFVRKRILEISKELGLFAPTAKIIDKIQYYAIRDSFGYGVIDVLMNDHNIEDIVEERYDKPVGVAHREFGEYGILDTNVQFPSPESANSFVQRLVQRTGKSLTAAVPYIDTMTKEGHRIAATFGKEVSLPGANFTIRKFSEEPYTISKLLQMGTINAMMATYLWMLLEAKSFLLVIGATSAGKTTTIGALSSLINPQMKITTIEDTPELKLGHTHWQRLITRKSSSIFETKYEVTMDDLIKLSLRSRPDYIVVGEVRGKEISSLIQAVSTGHGGLTSFHAFDANSAFVRMQSEPMNVHVGGQMLISAIVRQNRMVDPDGTVLRRVTNISEVIAGKSIQLNDLFKWDAMSQTFKPDAVGEVIEKSSRLRDIALVNGWTKEQLTAEFVSRMCFLSKMVNANVFRFDDVTKMFAKFYYDPLEKHTVVLETRSLYV